MPTRTLIPLAALIALALSTTSCSRAVAPTASGRAAAPDANLTTEIEPLPADFPDADGPVFRTAGPVAILTSPRPNHLLPPTLPPSFTFHWAPVVPAPGGPTPTRYRYRVFNESDTEFDFLRILIDPNSFLRFYAPGFAGWTVVGSDVTEATVSGLSPGEHHVLVLIAQDAHGNFGSVLSFDQNMLYFNVSFAAPGENGVAERGR